MLLLLFSSHFLQNLIQCFADEVQGLLSDFEPCGEKHNGAGFCIIPRSQHSELNSYHRIVTSNIVYSKILIVPGKFKSTAPNEESTCDTLMSLLGDLIKVCLVEIFIISTETQVSETDIFKAKCEIVHKMYVGKHPKDFFFPTCLVCLNNPSYPILSCSDDHMWCCEDCASHLIDSQGMITCSACQKQVEIRSEILYLYTLMMLQDLRLSLSLEQVFPEY